MVDHEVWYADEQLFHLEVVPMEEREEQCVPKSALDVAAENGEPFLQAVHQGALHLGQYHLIH